MRCHIARKMEELRFDPRAHAVKLTLHYVDSKSAKLGHF